MRNINDPSGIDALLVERLIGLSAYDIVKLVAMSLPEIQQLATTAEGLADLVAAQEQLLLLVPVIPELSEIAENLDALINGSKPASAITYNGGTVQEALDGLLYQPIVISGMTTTPSVVEAGQTVTQVDVAWTLSRSGTAQKMNGASIVPSLRAFTSLTPVNADAAFLLRVEEVVSGATRATEQTATLRFKRKRYWGASALTALDDIAIRALPGSEFADDRNKTIVFDATGGKYPYYVYPAAFGLPTVRVQGAIFTDFTVTTRAFVNASGSSASYNIIRFNGIQTGSSIEVAFA